MGIEIDGILAEKMEVENELKVYKEKCHKLSKAVKEYKNKKPDYQVIPHP